MFLKVPKSFIRLSSSSSQQTFPKTLNQLQEVIGNRLEYRSGNHELARYLLLNRLMTLKLVRDVLQKKQFVQDQQDVFVPLMNSSKYFNYRIHQYQELRDVEHNVIENFGGNFKSSGSNEFGDEDVLNLQSLFPLEQENSSLDFEATQDLISKVISYILHMDKKPSYKFYEVLIQNFNRLGLQSASTQVFDSMTKLPGEVTNFKLDDNFLCFTDESTLQLMLHQVQEQSFPREFKKLLDLLDLSKLDHMPLGYSNHPLFPMTSKRTGSLEPQGHKDLEVLRTRFFPPLQGQNVLLKNGFVHNVALPTMCMDSKTGLAYLKALYKMKKFHYYHYFLRKWIFNSVITEDKSLKILILMRESENFCKSYVNLQSVEDYSILFNKDLLKLILKYCYVTKDKAHFEWIMSILRKVFIVDQRSYLKYTYPLRVIDNEIVSLIWLNCKNLNFEMYSTWRLLDKIFKLEEIFNDCLDQRLIAYNSK